jgi:hypothetical protein
MRLKKFRFFLLYLVIIFTIIGLVPNGKINAASSNTILVDMVPSNPSPYEDVSITLNSYANDLDSVPITWFVNNKSVLSGIGKKKLLTKAGAAGSETMVVVTISLPEGNVETRMTIRPSGMILLWQANDSYVPPFYRGKALPTLDSEIKVVAMPEIKVGASFINPRSMTYAWKKDYANEVDGSGYGKNSFLYINDYLETANTISVTASTTDQKYSAESNVNIGAIQPKILFYKNDNTFGTMWNKALTDPYRLEGAEIVVAAPYFISPKDIRTPTLLWSWFINGSMVNVQGFKKNFMPLQVGSATSGTSTLKLQIENQYKIFQTVEKEISIEF